MNPGGQREEEIFASALELPANQRSGFLDQACADQPALRQRVETLLTALDRASPLLKNPVSLISERPSALPPTEKTGDRIGRYKLLEQIGEGGCGVVYVAEQEEPVRRRVALKVIKLGMDTKQVIARFEAERQALAMMDHPNIAKIHDAGVTDTGRPYFVMELVRGIKITDYCDQNHPSPRERLDLFIQVCRAIQHAHQKGIIHRDIKPSNVLVASDDGVPVPKVIDFGIAKATQGRLTDQTVYTAFEQFIGTPAYMSPEQASLTMQDIDTRSDIYSLGVLLYELLTGTTPFDAKELLAKGLDEMRRTIREIEPVKPSTRLTQQLNAKGRKGETEKRGNESPARASSTLNHQLSTDLDWIVMKCLEKDRTRRYETANGLATDIQRHLNNEPIVARPPSQWYSLQKLIRRKRAAFSAVAGVLLTLLLAVVGLTVSNVRIRNEQSQKEMALESAKVQLSASLKNQAAARRYSHRIGQRDESLAALQQAARIKHDEDLRDANIATLAVPDLRVGSAWQAYDSNDSGIAFDANYEKYARIDSQAEISIRTVADGREIQRFSSGSALTPSDHERALRFSPDGRWLAKRDVENCWTVWRVKDAQLVLRTPPTISIGAAISHDSTQFAIPIQDSIVVFDLDAGKERIRWPFQHEPQAMAFSPDNKQLAVGLKSPGMIFVFDAAKGQLSAQLPVKKSSDRALAWHPSGKYLAASSDDLVELWDVTAATLVSVMEGHAQTVTTLSFDPSGNWVTSDSWDGQPRLWQPSPGRECIRFFSGANHLRFSEDGRWAGVIYPGNGKAQLLEFIPSTIYHTFVGSLRDSQHPFHTASISPDGRLLAVASTDLSLRELPGGRELARLPVGGCRIIRFHPNGKQLLISGYRQGLEIWPIARDANTPEKLRFGPPRSLPLPFEVFGFEVARDGRTVSVSSENPAEARILDLDTGQLRDVKFPHPEGHWAALSPDARWIATSGWQSPLTQLWNAQTGELLLKLMGDHANLWFTPNGRELVVAQTDAYVFYDVGSKQITKRIERQGNMHPGWIAFTADEKLMALEISAGLIRLCEVATGRTIAHLQDPSGGVSAWMDFTPDGTQLIVGAIPRATHRWDLRAMRVELKAMGLDWEWPEFPSQSAEEKNPPPLEVEVLGGESR